MNGDLSLTKMVFQLLTINENFEHYSHGKPIHRYGLVTFNQTWGNTSGGFQCIGGVVP